MILTYEACCTLDAHARKSRSCKDFCRTVVVPSHPKCCSLHSRIGIHAVCIDRVFVATRQCTLCSYRGDDCVPCWHPSSRCPPKCTPLWCRRMIVHGRRPSAPAWCLEDDRGVGLVTLVCYARKDTGALTRSRCQQYVLLSGTEDTRDMRT